MELLRTTPPALTSRERTLIGVATVAVAVTRIWARSRTLWDWDETLFCLALRDYDVVQHHPHPPGFPLYIALAKLVRFFVQSDFHALQAITTTAAIALLPLLFWLAYELRFSFRTAYLGSLLFMFFPNVWFYGGTAFSDLPGLAFLFAACAILLRSCRDPRLYFLGALVLGLAAAIRPQALLIGCAPALLASWCRISQKRARDVAIASAIGIAVLAVSYGGAALASESVQGYFATARSLREYVRKVDSFLNPGRQPLRTLFGDFFIREVPGGHISAAISALALVAIVISLVRRTARVWLLLAMFLPFNVFGWFMLDTNSISRYSVSYSAMYAILAADALAAVPLVQTIAIAAIVARLMWWALPALRDVRSTSSPPVAAMKWIRDSVPRSGKLYVHGSMGPWSTYLLGGYETTFIEDPAELPLQPVNGWFVTEGSTAVAGAHNFVRDRGRLFDIARRRYFEVSVSPASGLLRFGSGWYGEESVGTSAWRWMSGRSETLLPPIDGPARLSIGFDLPTELVPRHPTITVQLNGQMIDRFVCTTPSVRKSWIVPARGEAWNRLIITLDKVINPEKEGLAPDARDLGLNLTSYSWGPAG
ncbi:MAG TPA: hypothetical protein VGK31_07070 [Thermoanaerobaculia bacterium]